MMSLHIRPFSNARSSKLHRSYASVDGWRLAVLGDGVDDERLGLFADHAWRARRHPWKRYARYWRSLREEFAHYLHGHVTIDDIAIDEHRVAALIFLRHASFPADLCEIIGRLHLDLETVLPQIGGIAFAAGALRVLVQCRLYR